MASRTVTRGLASYFADLADRKLALGGTLALVLPLPR